MSFFFFFFFLWEGGGGNLQLQCISRIANSKIMESKLTLIFWWSTNSKMARKISLIFVHLVCLEICHFSFWNASCTNKPCHVQDVNKTV